MPFEASVNASRKFAWQSETATLKMAMKLKALCLTAMTSRSLLSAKVDACTGIDRAGKNCTPR